MRLGSRLVRCGPALAAAVGALAVTALAAQDDASVQKALAQARKAAGELTERVRAMLGEHMAQGGPEGAVAVCSETSHRMTRELRSRTGYEVRRVSLKYRSPGDAPDGYERGKLEEFDRLQKQGTLPVEDYEVVGGRTGPALRYMRPLVAGPMCLTCHGAKDAIPVAVRAVLDRKYPGDRATGYGAGEVRGAVSVTVPLGPTR
jgi:Protein of unknown function (DUF3365)